MGQIFKSKEIYKHLKYTLHDRHEMVPVQGVYISGEYRPPYYNNPIVRITQIDSQNARADSFKTENKKVSSAKAAGLYQVDISSTSISLVRYSVESTTVSSASAAGLYNVGIGATTFGLQRYGRDYESPTPTSAAGMYNINLTDSTFNVTPYLSVQDGSTPEPILRLSSLVSELATIENYNP